MKTEKKPIKRSKELIQLSRDHHDGLLLCWKIRTGLKNNIETERISDYVLQYFAHELKEHFKQEEEILFVLLSDNDPMKIEVLAQHDILYGMIETLKNKPLEPAHLLNRFADQLDDHIRYEERKLFPYIEEQIDLTLLKKAGEKIDQLHQQHIALEWVDEFWIKRK